MKHVHYDLMMEWAADTSKVVEVLTSKSGWRPADMPPKWNPMDKYRIKPESKPDVVCDGLFGFYSSGHLCYYVSSAAPPNLRLTFSGEDGKLIKAEVLK